jgi:hypothetical protein
MLYYKIKEQNVLNIIKFISYLSIKYQNIQKYNIIIYYLYNITWNILNPQSF